MGDITLEHVWQLVEQLSPKDRNSLVDRLLTRPTYPAKPLTLERILALRKHRLATGESISGLPSLRNAYTDTSLDMTDEQLRDSIKSFGKQWEHELDDYRPND